MLLAPRLSLLLALSCTGSPAPDDSGPPPAADAWTWDIPDGYPEPAVPEDNPMTPAKVALGRYLFYDKRLSGNGTQSCGSCHEQARGFTDGKAHAVGSTGVENRRSAMALANIVYASTLTWADSSLRTLEDQALKPMLGEDPVELGLAGHEDEMLANLAADADYPARFAAAFPGEADPFTLDNVVKAIACFERSLVSSRSAYDRFWYRHEPDALTDGAQRALVNFDGEKGACIQCHFGFTLTDAVADADGSSRKFHNTGLYNEDGNGSYPETDQGLIEVTGHARDMGKFKAPSLLNIAVTGPYMHDGSIATLDEVLDHYTVGGRASAGSAYVDPTMREFTLTASERADYLQLFDAFTDQEFLSNPAFSDPFAE